MIGGESYDKNVFENRPITPVIRLYRLYINHPLCNYCIEAQRSARQPPRPTEQTILIEITVWGASRRYALVGCATYLKLQTTLATVRQQY